MGSPKVVIVGAGMSGICQAAALKQVGLTDITILEKADSLGGTWRDNRYPGLTCDVPSHLYQYSFHLEAGWTQLFAPGPEIRDYFVHSARKLGIDRLIRFGTEVTAAHHDGQRWLLTVDAGRDQIDCDFVIFATGILHRPVIPKFEGLASFEGNAFHSARWDNSVDVRGKRVAVIGSGSTGVQLVSALAGVAARTTLFQRTPQWVMRMPNPPVPAPVRIALRRSGLARKAVYRAMYEFTEIFANAVTRDGVERRAVETLCKANLASVRDSDLRRKLTPNDRPMCRRLVMHPDFYEKVQRPDVRVETSGIDRFEPQGIRTVDGRLHELDVVIIATGFDAHSYLLPTTVSTSTGNTLAEAWKDGPRAYRGVAVAGIPNFFLLMGPHSPIGNFSLVKIAESQTGYIATWIRRCADRNYSALTPRQAAVDAHYEHIKAGVPGTAWATGCKSWYIGADGLPELWTYSPKEYFDLMTGIDYANYAIRVSNPHTPARNR